MVSETVCHHAWQNCSAPSAGTGIVEYALKKLIKHFKGEKVWEIDFKTESVVLKTLGVKVSGQNPHQSKLH